MKLKNKKTGETGYYLHTHRDYKTGVLKIAVLKDGVPFSEFKPYEPIYDYDSLAELNEEWEDYYEEPKKGTYFINTQGDVQFWDSSSFAYPDDWTKEKLIGNYFETKEEAEKAVEKLKAWKRLKDKGFSFGRWQFLDDRSGIWVRGNLVPGIVDELDILFGGEE